MQFVRSGILMSFLFVGHTVCFPQYLAGGFLLSSSVQAITAGIEYACVPMHKDPLKCTIEGAYPVSLLIPVAAGIVLAGISNNANFKGGEMKSFCLGAVLASVPAFIGYAVACAKGKI